MAKDTTTITITTPSDESNNHRSSSSVSFKRKRNNDLVDEAFERMFGYPWGTTFDLQSYHLNHHRVHQFMEMFGKERAARLLAQISNLPSITTTATTTTTQTSHSSKRPKTKTTTTISLPTAATTLQRTGVVDKDVLTKRAIRLEDYKDIKLPESLLQDNKNKEVETKVFAGQTIQLKTTNNNNIAPPDGVVSSNTANATFAKTLPSALAGGTAKPTTNLDQVLSQLSGPSKLNTVEKTSHDWEKFKSTDKQLQEELEKRAQGKDAYLVKQDFLNRVDQRKFELERDEREQERAKRAASK